MDATFEKRVEQYVKLRDLIKAEDDAHKAKMQQKRDVLEQLNGMILDMLNKAGVENVKTKAGTAYRKTKKSATIADAALFRRHVIGGEHFDLIDWRANVTAVAEWIEENHEPPPGVNFSTTVDVGVRRGNEK